MMSREVMLILWNLELCQVMPRKQRSKVEVTMWCDTPLSNAHEKEALFVEWHAMASTTQQAILYSQKGAPHVFPS